MSLAFLRDTFRQRPWLGFLVAAVVVALEIVVRRAFGDSLNSYPFLLPVAVVTLVMYLAGVWPAISAAVALYGLTKWFFIPPVGSLALLWPSGLIGLAFYSLLNAIIIVLMQRMTRAEASLRLLNRELESRVLERTAALEDESRRRDEAQAQIRQMQKMEAVGQLTGGVAHDFNNLLTVIRGSVDLLRRPNLTDEKRARYIEAIGDTADRAARLTSQLLAFARRQTLKPETFDVGVSLRELNDVVGTLAGSRVSIALDLPDTPCHILADRSQFDTAILNLAVNARDAMGGEGEVSIAVRSRDHIPPVRSHPTVFGRFVAVSVADTGHGVKADLAERIFEPFFTTKQVGEGTGLGLSQVIGFAKQSGGDIVLESGRGGATFTLYLPMADAIAADQPSATVHEVADGDGVCALVVEDNTQVGEFATQALREIGYDSVLAVDARAALNHLRDTPGRFHIVFSDVMMPGMSGIELGEEIRRLHPDLPVVLASGYSHVLAESGSSGFDLIGKPYSVEQLSAALRKALGTRQQRLP